MYNSVCIKSGRRFNKNTGNSFIKIYANIVFILLKAYISLYTIYIFYIVWLGKKEIVFFYQQLALVIC